MVDLLSHVMLDQFMVQFSFVHSVAFGSSTEQHECFEICRY